MGLSGTEQSQFQPSPTDPLQDTMSNHDIVSA